MADTCEETKQIDFTIDFDDCDVKIIVEDETLYAHSLLLSMNSPVFKAMLKSNFKEGISKTIELPGKSKASVIELLRMIYQLADAKVEKNGYIDSLLDLAEEYQLKGIKSSIERHLCAETWFNVCSLKRAEKYDMKDLEKLVCSKLTYRDIKHEEDIRADNKITIMQKSLEAFSSEFSSFKYAIERCPNGCHKEFYELVGKIDRAKAAM